MDSRAVVAGQRSSSPCPGERTDGHAFLAEAVDAPVPRRSSSPARRADPAALGDVTVVRVADGLARPGRGRGRLAPPLRSARRRDHRQHRQDLHQGGGRGRPRRSGSGPCKSEGNQNNEIGLPLTLLRLGPEHEAAVLEMGMYVGGEIADLAAIGRPSIGVVTAVQPVHLSRIGTLDADRGGQGRARRGAAARTATAILNADDPLVRRMADANGRPDR